MWNFSIFKGRSHPSSLVLQLWQQWHDLLIDAKRSPAEPEAFWVRFTLLQLPCCNFSAAPIPPGSTHQGKSCRQHCSCREEALEPGAGVGGGDLTGTHVQSNLVKQHASAGSGTPCASPLCRIWHVQCQIMYRSWDVGMHSQGMIPSDLLPSPVMQLPRSLTVPEFWQFRGLHRDELDLFYIKNEMHLGRQLYIYI